MPSDLTSSEAREDTTPADDLAPIAQTPAGSASPRRRTTARERTILAVLVLLALAVIAAYMTVDLKGPLEFALKLRGRKVAAMVLVGIAIGHSTVVFQTVTNNRILTPSIMGFDSLYVLIQTGAVYLLGSLVLVQIDPRLQFGFEVLVMIGFAGVLYRWLFGRQEHDLYLLVLVGVVLGTLFSSLTSFVSRMIDPNEFLTLQDRVFASFGSVDDDLLVVSAIVVALVVADSWRSMRALDVVALGRDHAINLGVPHRRTVNRTLVGVAVMVSVGTALVGPITFFGLLVANLARQMTGTFRHVVTIPVAALLGVVSLVGGQLTLERLFGFNTSLSIIINFVGGIYFIGLLIKEARR